LAGVGVDPEGVVMEEGSEFERPWSRLGVPALLREMSLRRTALEARRAAARFWPMARELSMAAVAVDGRGIVILWNPAAERLFGWTRAETVGRPSPLGEPLGGATVQKRKDGGTVPVHGWLTPLASSREETVGHLVLFADRTEELEQAAERERRSEEARRARVDAERVSKRARWLERAAAVLSAPLDETATLIGLAQLAAPELGDYCLVDRWDAKSRVLERMASQASDPPMRAIATALERGGPAPASTSPLVLAATGGVAELIEVDVEARLLEGVEDLEARRALRKLGAKSAVVAPLRARGRTLGVITVIHGPSDRRHQPVDLESIEALAQTAALALDNARLYGESLRAVKQRDENLSAASHDLKNPLLAVRMESERILREPIEGEGAPRVREAASRVVRVAQQMNQLVTQLLDFALLQAGKAGFQFDAVSPRALIDEAIDAFQPVAAAQNVELVWEPPAEQEAFGDELRVHCDRGRIWQVLSNLVGNAIRHGQGARVVLSAARHGGEVRFSVRDDGRGLPDTNLESLFDALPTDRRQRGGSSGLGLAICRGIVEAHGGWIWAETESGRGCVFCFTLPIAS
jgi:signal transduction histidine kinase